MGPRMTDRAISAPPPSPAAWRSRVESIARTAPFRAAVATLILMLHIFAAAAFGWSRFGLPFNRAPGEAPAFRNPAAEESPPRWNRLVIARWDSEHYINL